MQRVVGKVGAAPIVFVALAVDHAAAVPFKVLPERRIFDQKRAVGIQDLVYVDLPRKSIAPKNAKELRKGQKQELHRWKDEDLKYSAWRARYLDDMALKF
jgi:hypothetical protein